MADSERRKRGEEMITKVYAGDVAVPPEGTLPFSDVMLEQLFAEVWTRESLSMRDKRLLLLGAIAALGEPTPFGVQAKAALKNGELTPDELRECLVMLVQYVGYPRASGLVMVIEQTINDAARSGTASSPT
jgi:4-carboxymuconolactone decarboxylase